jgi:hypothetical protein
LRVIIPTFSFTSVLEIFWVCLVLAVYCADMHSPLQEGGGGLDRLAAPRLEPARQLGVLPTGRVYSQEPQQPVRLLNHRPGSWDHKIKRAHCNKHAIYVFPGKELCGLSPNFALHVSVNDLVYSQDRSTYFLQQNMQI